MTEQNEYISDNRSDSEKDETFASDHGHSRTVRRIDRQYILSEIASVLNFDKGILYTIRELLLRPGSSVYTFIHEDRTRLVRPVVYIIICSLVYTVLQELAGFEDGYLNYSLDEYSASKSIFEWVSRNYGYANILISVFIAFWIRILFRKHDYNFYELLILLCFIIGTGMLIFTFWGVVDSLVPITIIDKGFLVGLFYIAWGIGQFFTGNKIKNSLKGFFSYILGILSFALIIQLIGSLVDWAVG